MSHKSNSESSSSVSYLSITRILIPAMLSGVAIPIPGLIDVALLGNFGSTPMVGAVALSAALLSLILGTFSFLRAIGTGFCAQLLGAKDWLSLWRFLLNISVIAIIFSITLMIASGLIFNIAIGVLQPAAEISGHFDDYFSIRMYGVFFIFVTFVCIGFLIGVQKIRAVLFIYTSIAVINIILSFILIVLFGLGVIGTALGSLFAEAIGMVLSVKITFDCLKRLPVDMTRIPAIARLSDLKIIFSNSGNHTLRTILLAAGLLFFNDLSESLGVYQFAANTILWNIFFIIVFILDGYAYTGETLCGQAVGGGNSFALKKIIAKLTILSHLTAILMSLSLYFASPAIAALMTRDARVLEYVDNSILWFSALPIVSVSCFLLDGICIGFLAIKVMRNFMILSMIIYLPLGYLLTHLLGNTGLWIGIMLFFAVRGLAFFKLPSMIREVGGKQSDERTVKMTKETI